MVEGTDDARSSRFAVWITLLSVLPELITAGVLLVTTFRTPPPAQAETQPTGPVAATPRPSSAAPTVSTRPSTPVPVPPPVVVPSVVVPPVDRPLVGAACVPGVWKARSVTGRPPGTGITLGLVGEGHVMTFTALGGGMVDNGGGMWLAGQDGARSVKVLTTGTNAFQWQSTAQGLALTYGASTLVVSSYTNDVLQSSGPSRYPDKTVSFSCAGDGLRLVDGDSTTDLTRVP
ncbi:hypothetical protein R8Z50_20295 [Longispora sp. K20-0274]|uniref:hypothetical protein n=1 Tax=Longispora sp. K20-0274 TaxID=3088255 RepID=UPI00399A0D04